MMMEEWISGGLPTGRDLFRRGAWARFEEAGLPHKRLEGWAYSDMETALQNAPPLLPQRPSDQEGGRFQDIKALAKMKGWHLVLADGFLMTPPDHFPKEKGLEILPLSEALRAPPPWLQALFKKQEDKQKDGALLALNKALSEDGVLIRVRAGAQISKPLHLLFSSCWRASYPALIILLEKGARLSLIETHRRQKRAGFLNLWRDLHLEEGAALHHLIMQEEQKEVVHASSNSASLAEGSSLKVGILSEGAKIARMNWESHLEAPHASARLSAIFLLGENAHSDITAEMLHNKPHAVSTLCARALLQENATGIFQARAHIAHGADGSDASQDSRALLLAPRAHMHVKPELAIYADDVQCAHGSAVGALDEEALFYLRQRGLPQTEARKALAQAFLRDGLEALRGTDLHDRAVAESLSSLDRLWEHDAAL